VLFFARRVSWVFFISNLLWYILVGFFNILYHKAAQGTLHSIYQGQLFESANFLGIQQKHLRATTVAAFLDKTFSTGL
jgi:hypothetical protein